MNAQDKEEALTLEILQAIDQEEGVTQRHLAQRLGVALGLANSYLKRCVRKGLIKIQQAPANRYLYYLTPMGFAEKSRLTAQYLSFSLTFYRKAAESCARAFRYCEGQGWRRLVLCGVSDLAEIAALRAQEHRVEVVAVYDPESARAELMQYRTCRNLPDVALFDACVITDLDDPCGRYEQLLAQIPRERLVVPDILGLKPKG